MKFNQGSSISHQLILGTESPMESYKKITKKIVSESTHFPRMFGSYILLYRISISFSLQIQCISTTYLPLKNTYQIFSIRVLF